MDCFLFANSGKFWFSFCLPMFIVLEEELGSFFLLFVLWCHWLRRREGFSLCIWVSFRFSFVLVLLHRLQIIVVSWDWFLSCFLSFSLNLTVHVGKCRAGGKSMWVTKKSSGNLIKYMGCCYLCFASVKTFCNSSHHFWIDLHVQRISWCLHVLRHFGFREMLRLCCAAVVPIGCFQSIY